MSTIPEITEVPAADLPSGPAEFRESTTTEGLPIAPSLSPALHTAGIGRGRPTAVDKRVAYVTGLAILLGLAAGGIAQLLIRLIGLITNVAFFGRISTELVSPAGNHLGAWVIGVPAVGGLMVGLMARYGARAIRGHGIPEAMEQVLYNKSRIPARMAFLKPLSAAISIGTGGPFGAEGPIIATGGALGSLLGQLLRTAASERKTLLAAGAAAGLTATFGNPVSSLLLAIELLLFEFSPRSFIPVGMACCAAAAIRILFMGFEPAFRVPELPGTGSAALVVYVAIGAGIGVVSVWTTEAVAWIEHQFERIPIPWMWYPAIGGLVVGLIGWRLPHTMGPGYDTIEGILRGDMTGTALLYFFAFKMISWATSVGSGTSGGTLAPMFAMGGCLGGAAAAGVAWLFPALGVAPSVAALVGMAAIFTGASRALLASVVLTFETTHQFQGILPLLAGCVAAYLVSGLMMHHTIMTEKFLRSGRRVPVEYVPDLLSQINVEEAASPRVVTLRGMDPLDEVRAWLGTDTPDTRHQGYPVTGSQGEILGVVLRRELMNPSLNGSVRVSELVKRPPVIVHPGQSLRHAVHLMFLENVGRVLVLEPGETRPASAQGIRLLGILTRSDIHSICHSHDEEEERRERTLSVTLPFAERLHLRLGKRSETRREKASQNDA